MTHPHPSALRASALTIFLSCTIGLSACQSASNNSQHAAKDSVDRAAADIGDLRYGGKQVTSILMPEGFKRGDKIVAYEGPGWESDKVAYRIYLDGRNALDIFGKKTPDLVLSKVGRGDDYKLCRTQMRAPQSKLRIIILKAAAVMLRVSTRPKPENICPTFASKVIAPCPMRRV